MVHYGIYFTRINRDTKNYGGAEWVIDGERGRYTYPHCWKLQEAKEVYRNGLDPELSNYCDGCIHLSETGKCRLLLEEENRGGYKNEI